MDNEGPYYDDNPYAEEPYHDHDPYAGSSNPSQSQSDAAPEDQPAHPRALIPTSQALQSIRGYGTPQADTPGSHAAAAGQQPSADRVLELQQQIQRASAAMTVAEALSSAPCEQAQAAEPGADAARAALGGPAGVPGAQAAAIKQKQQGEAGEASVQCAGVSGMVQQVSSLNAAHGSPHGLWGPFIRPAFSRQSAVR